MNDYVVVWLVGIVAAAGVAILATLVLPRFRFSGRVCDVSFDLTAGDDPEPGPSSKAADS